MCFSAKTKDFQTPVNPQGELEKFTACLTEKLS